jgi:hypothetical protein
LTEEETDIGASTDDSQTVPDSNQSDDSGLSKGSVAGISILATVACIVAASVAIVKYRKYRSQYRPLRMPAARPRYGTVSDQPPEVQVET